MELDVVKVIGEAIRAGMVEGIKSKLNASYDNPLLKYVNAAIEQHGPQMQKLLAEAIQSCIGDQGFKDYLNNSVRAKLAQILVQRFGGELEKQVNQLKSDPLTRAKITTAIDEVIKSCGTA